MARKASCEGTGAAPPEYRNLGLRKRLRRWSTSTMMIRPEAEETWSPAPGRSGTIRAASRALAASALVLLAAACAENDDPMVPDPPDIDTLTFAPELEVDLSQMNLTPTGLYEQDVVVGEGIRVDTGDGIQFNFQGWLHDGTDVDQGFYPTNMFAPGAIQGADGDWYYQVGSGQTLAAWDLGLGGMNVGGTRKLVIPPHLAYGNLGSPDGRVPPNAVLVYVLEILAGEP